MRTRPPSSIRRPHLSSGWGMALALTTSLSVLEIAGAQSVWSKSIGVWSIAFPHRLTNVSPAAVDFPRLSPRVEGDIEVDSERRSPQPTNIAVDLIAVSNSETAGPGDRAEDRSIDRDRSLSWLIVGSLALMACLGGWLLLIVRNQHLLADKVVATPAPGQRPTPEVTLESTNPTSPSAQTNALAAADLPLEPTTRLSSSDLVDSWVQELSSADSAVRRQAIWNLGQRGHSDMIQPLVESWLEADSQEKSLILAALAEISSRSLKPMHRALSLGLQDPSPEVRKNAIRDLSRVYDPVLQLSHMLAHATQDADPSVRETAQWALSQLSRISANPASGALSPETSTLNSNVLEPPGDRVSPS